MIVYSYGGGTRITSVRSKRPICAVVHVVVDSIEQNNKTAAFTRIVLLFISSEAYKKRNSRSLVFLGFFSFCLFYASPRHPCGFLSDYWASARAHWRRRRRRPPSGKQYISRYINWTYCRDITNRKKERKKKMIKIWYHENVIHPEPSFLDATYRQYHKSKRFYIRSKI